MVVNKKLGAKKYSDLPTSSSGFAKKPLFKKDDTADREAEKLVRCSKAFVMLKRSDKSADHEEALSLVSDYLEVLMGVAAENEYPAVKFKARALLKEKIKVSDDVEALEIIGDEGYDEEIIRCAIKRLSDIGGIGQLISIVISSDNVYSKLSALKALPQYPGVYSFLYRELRDSEKAEDTLVLEAMEKHIKPDSLTC